MADRLEIMLELERRGKLPEDKAVIINELRKRGKVPQPASVATAQEAKTPGFFGNLNEDLVRRGVNIADELTTTKSEPFGETLQRFPERALRVTGQAAGFVGDVGAEALKSVYTTIAPERFQKAVSNSALKTMSTPRNKRFAEGVEKRLQEAKTNYPEHYKNVEAMANIAGVALASKPTGAISDVTKKGAKTGSDIAINALKKSPAALDKDIKKIIREGVEKSIRPSVEGKRTFGSTEKYFANAQQAVENIVLNKNNLNLTDDAGDVVVGLPSSLKQFSQAVSQTKQQIFKQYDDLAKESGRAGAKVDLAPIANQLNEVTKSSVLQDNAPQVAAYAKRLSETYTKRGSYTTTQAQEAIAHFNNSLDAFYKNPSYDTASKAYLDSLVVNNLRKSLDNVIETAGEPGYQKLKNAYGSLKAIERDINRRSIVDARKNAKGLIDFSDVFSGGAAVHGILSMNPAIVGEAVAAKSIARLYRWLNDPNRVVKNMFEKTEKVLKKKGMINDRKLTDVIRDTEQRVATSGKVLDTQGGTSLPIVGRSISENNQ